MLEWSCLICKVSDWDSNSSYRKLMCELGEKWYIYYVEISNPWASLFLHLLHFLWFLLSERLGSACNSVQYLSHVPFFETPWTQHARLCWPSPAPGACSNSYPSSRWCHASTIYILLDLQWSIFSHWMIVMFEWMYVDLVPWELIKHLLF